MAKTWDCVNAYVAPLVGALIETTGAPGCFGAPCYAAARPATARLPKRLLFWKRCLLQGAPPAEIVGG